MTEILHTQSKRLYESIASKAGEEKANYILNELPLSKAPTDKRKGEWACNSCQLLCQNFDQETVESIRRNCHCKPSPDFVKQLKKLWEETGSLNEFARKATESSKGAYEIKTDNSTLIMIYPVCYCPFLKNTEARVPVEWCYCTLGYSEDMFTQVLGKKVSCKLMESVATGGKCCRIVMELL